MRIEENYVDDDDAGKLALYIKSDWTPDVNVTLPQLIELRSTIDNYLWEKIISKIS